MASSLLNLESDQRALQPGQRTPVEEESVFCCASLCNVFVLGISSMLFSTVCPPQDVCAWLLAWLLCEVGSSRRGDDMSNATLI